MNHNLIALLENVDDEKTFLEFVEALSADKLDEVKKEEENPSSPYSPGVNGWETDVIEDFLDSAVRWANATQNGTPHYEVPSNPWMRCAEILYAGKIYE